MQVRVGERGRGPAEVLVLVPCPLPRLTPAVNAVKCSGQKSLKKGAQGIPISFTSISFNSHAHHISFTSQLLNPSNPHTNQIAVHNPIAPNKQRTMQLCKHTPFTQATPSSARTSSRCHTVVCRAQLQQQQHTTAGGELFKRAGAAALTAAVSLSLLCSGQ